MTTAGSAGARGSASANAGASASIISEERTARDHVEMVARRWFTRFAPWAVP